MFFFDPMYLLFLAPAMLLAGWAQWRVHSAYAQASRYAPSTGYSGAQAAHAMLESAGIEDVEIDRVDGFLSDHYDSSHKVLRLSPGVYGQRNLAAVGIAAHEAGHAIQDATGYFPLVLRNTLVPVASLGSNVAWLIIFLGFFLHMFGLIMAGIVLFSGVVLFQLVNLPVEFNASRRARIALLESGMLTLEEDVIVGKVLNAAALTYVAATLSSALTLLYFILRYGNSRN